MKGDFTRETFRSRKQYTGVRLQQGRVQLDSDWNEQSDILTYLRETGTADALGPCGVPKKGGGFEIVPTSDGANLFISSGRMYVDGILCERGTEPELPVAVFTSAKTIKVTPKALQEFVLKKGDWVEFFSNDALETKRVFTRVKDVAPAKTTLTLETGLPSTDADSKPRLRHALTYTAQPDFPGAELPTADGAYFAYACVWRRHMTPLDDPEIRETALNGADTATRLKTVWQVKLLKVGGVADSFDCLSDPKAWEDEAAPGSGRLGARAKPDEKTDKKCIVPAKAGFTRLENQLYRVEVHKGQSLGSATFKWSRDNGSVVAAITAFPDTKKIQVKNLGRDEVRRLKKDDWVEVLDDANELNGEPGALVRIIDINEEQRLITLNKDVSSFDKDLHPKLRRWDSKGELTVETPAANGGWLKLENGVEIRFEKGTYKTGDYWLIPARAFIGEFAGDVEWPKDEGNDPLALKPHGVLRHYCRLAVLKRSGGKWSVTGDCRKVFPAATEHRRISYVGGGGQEAMPGQRLPCPLRVSVTNGAWPVAGAKVRFEAASASLAPTSSTGLVSTLTAETGEDGVAECNWTLNGPPNDAKTCLQVTARLLDAAGVAQEPPVIFSANHSIASTVSYNPSGCQWSSSTNVQQAMDDFCRLLQNPYLVLRHLGGDGQEGQAYQKLPCTLTVGVEDQNGRPVKDAAVEFEVTDGNGGLTNPGSTATPTTKITAVSDDGGSVGVDWTLGAGDGCQYVKASLVNPPQGEFLPVVFKAHAAEARTGIALPKVNEIGWKNDRFYNFSKFKKDGLRVVFSEKMDNATVSNDTFIVTLEAPYSGPYREYFPADQSIILEGKVIGNGNSWVFLPARRFTLGVLNRWIVQKIKNGVSDKIRCRVTLKGDAILSEGKGLPLDGKAHFKVIRGATTLIPHSGDGAMGGDFESWFYLASPGLTLSRVKGNFFKLFPASRLPLFTDAFKLAIDHAELADTAAGRTSFTIDRKFQYDQGAALRKWEGAGGRNRIDLITTVSLENLAMAINSMIGRLGIRGLSVNTVVKRNLADVESYLKSRANTDMLLLTRSDKEKISAKLGDKVSPFLIF